jgi:large repetitive protein
LSRDERKFTDLPLRWTVSRIALVIFALAVAGLMAFGASEATASHVSCGDTITADTTLDSDLDCADLSGTSSALTIGAHRVTLDLNGHTISTACEADCAGTAVIDDRGGYDRVRILDGTIRPNGVAVGVALVDVDESTLDGLTIAGFPRPMNQPGVGILLSNSHRNELDSSTIGGGDPALLLSASDRNEISRSSVDGGIAIHQGDGIRLADGSDHNRIVDSLAGADGTGIVIWDSAGNTVTRSRVVGIIGGIVGRGAHRNEISRNTLSETFGGVVIDMASSDENVIERNEAPGGLLISGDRNRVEHNDVSARTGISVPQGDANLVRNNNVSGGIDGIAVASAATNTLVQGNLVTGAVDDGIDVDAPGTIIRANTATDNGDLGIEAVAGVIDGGGNRASGNGNLQQCTNVACR